MSDTIIYEDGQEVIYDTESPILFSATAENKLGLGVTFRRDFNFAEESKLNIFLCDFLLLLTTFPLIAK